jgi:hypothetical protein
MFIRIQAIALEVLRLIDQVDLNLATGQKSPQQPAGHILAPDADGES